MTAGGVGRVMDIRPGVAAILRNDEGHIPTCLFACRRIGGELFGSEGGTAWGWFSPDALPPDLTA